MAQSTVKKGGRGRIEKKNVSEAEGKKGVMLKTKKKQKKKGRGVNGRSFSFFLSSPLRSSK